MRSALVVVVAVSATAYAEDPKTLIDRGEELARRGEFSQAIAIFKQADAQQPNVANACRIALAYTRRELWSQAEVFFQRCRARATAADPVPEWLADAESQLAGKLAAADAAPIDVHVEPKLAGARVLVSSFPPDEQFEPSMIHLAPGTYSIVASAPGREPTSVTLTVVPRVAQIVTLVLPPPLPPPPPPPTREQIIGGWLLVGAVGAVVIGGVAHGIAYYERGQLDDAKAVHDPVAWDQHAGSFEAARAVAIAGYTLAIGAAITGYVLRRHHPEAPAVTASIGAHGATVGVAW